MRAALDQGFHIVLVEVAIALRLGQHREIRQGEGKTADAENVDAQVGDLLLDVKIGALHQGHHGDERGDAHGQAQHGERGTQLVRAEGVYRKCQVLGKAGHYRDSAPGRKERA